MIWHHHNISRGIAMAPALGWVNMSLLIGLSELVFFILCFSGVYRIFLIFHLLLPCP